MSSSGMTTRVTATRRLAFCAAHRLPGHAGRCKYLHGHNYVAEVTVERVGFAERAVDGLGMVADFGDIRRVVGGWVDDYWDHSVILGRDDRAGLAAVEALRAGMRDEVDGSGLEPSCRWYVMECAPTAENMARLLLCKAQSLLDAEGIHVRVTRVVVRETDSGLAEAVAPEAAR